mgnify:CR=1 FL=1
MKNTNRLKLLLNLYKFFKPKLYKKMILTGRLFEFLTKEYDEELKIEKKHYVEASYLCNIGFLGIDEFLNHENFDKDSSLDLIKNHVMLSCDFLEKNDFEEAARIVELHHELPNGMGYLKIQLQDKLIAYLNIADEFIDLTIDYYKNTPLQIASGACKIILGKYKNSNLIPKDELNQIENNLILFHERFILNV